MLKILFILALAAIYTVYGHNDLKANDGDMQSALMPQELNPVFVPDSEAELQNLHKELNQLKKDMEELKRRNGLPSSKNLEEHPLPHRSPKPVQQKPPSQPWRSVIPLPRSRRNSESVATLLNETTTVQQVKHYSRIITGVVLGIAAIIELVIYCIEMYYG